MADYYYYIALVSLPAQKLLDAKSIAAKDWRDKY
jgi:hypothetical protein